MAEGTATKMSDGKVAVKKSSSWDFLLSFFLPLPSVSTFANSIACIALVKMARVRSETKKSKRSIGAKALLFVAVPQPFVAHRLCPRTQATPTARPSHRTSTSCFPSSRRRSHR